MTDEFFDRRKPWSNIKHNVLKKYLVPYIRKTSKLGKPIIIVDGFAGPGIFKDGSVGSPMIICQKAKEEGERCKVGVVGIFVDKRQEYCDSLNRLLKSYIDENIAVVACDRFEEVVDQVIEILGTCTAFFYLDPFGIKGIEIEILERIFKRVYISSTEVLVNFSYPSFARHAGNYTVNDDEDTVASKVKKAKKDMVNRVMGGNYWVEIMTDRSLSVSKRETKVLEVYANRYREHFNFIGHCPVKDRDKNIAKYHLIFGTRHFDGLDLMSTIMHNEFEDFLIREYKEGYLFDTRPEHLKKQLDRLKEDILAVVEQHRPLSRRMVREKLVPEKFMRFAAKDYNKIISELLKQEAIFSATGKIRINDDVLLSTERFKQQ